MDEPGDQPQRRNSHADHGDPGRNLAVYDALEWDGRPLHAGWSVVRCFVAGEHLGSRRHVGIDRHSITHAG